MRSSLNIFPVALLVMAPWNESMMLLTRGQMNTGSLRRSVKESNETISEMDHAETKRHVAEALDKDDTKFWETVLRQQDLSLPPPEPPVPRPPTSPVTPLPSLSPLPSPTRPPAVATLAPALPSRSPSLPTPSPAQTLVPSTQPNPLPPTPRPIIPLPSLSPTISTVGPVAMSPIDIPTLAPPTISTVAPVITLPPTDIPTLLPTSSTVAPVVLLPTDTPALPPTSSTAGPVALLPTDIPTLPPTSSTVPPVALPPTSMPMLLPTSSTVAPVVLSPTSMPTLLPTSSTVAPVALPPTSMPTLSPIVPPTPQPTLAPTSSPTEPPSNSPSRLGQCSLEATATCVVLPERSSCSTLSKIPDDEVTCRAPPTELGWIYTGRNCGPLDDSRVGFACEDSNGGPVSSVVSYMIVRGTNTGSEYFSGLLFRMMGGLASSTFVMSSGDPAVLLDTSVDVQIRRSSMDGEILQRMTIPTSCSSDVDDLTIGKRFGAALFDSYRTDENGPVKGSQQVQWEYTVVNSGSVEAEITSVMTETHDDMADLMPTDDVVLQTGEDFRVPVDKTISLVESGLYTGSVNFTAVSTGGECSADAMSMFAIT